MTAELDLHYTPAQLRVFNEANPRFVTIAKGRRLGFTKGCANYCIERLLLGERVLWVDTVQSNLQGYFDMYFLPELKKLPRSLYSFSVQDKKLKLGNGQLDMKSAERPENIEGFKYDLVVLNEAGIILKEAKGKALWENSISPMLLDNPHSRAIIGGVPKGKNFFYDLSRKSLSDENWKHFTFTSFDNPLLRKDEIIRLIEELGGEESKAVRQEIYGEFLDESSKELFSLTEIEKAMSKGASFSVALLDGLCLWGVDVARFGDDKSVLCVRQGACITEFKEYEKLSLTDLASRLLYEYNVVANKPKYIFVDSVGIGAGLCDILRSYHLPIYEANFANKSSEKGYLNKRAQSYFNLAKKLKNLEIFPNETLKKELRMISFDYDNAGLLKIISKDEIKKLYGKSPDYADALALCFYEDMSALSVENTRESWDFEGV